MSEENAPKLRLKPKLATDPVVVPLSPAQNPPLPEAPPPPAAADEPKGVRLKPRLSLPPAPPVGNESWAPPEPLLAPVDLPPPAGVFPPPIADFAAPLPAGEAEKPVSRFSLKPKVAAESARAEFPPPALAPIEAVSVPVESAIHAPELAAPAQSGDTTGFGAPQSATAMPFPPPPGNFPAPPGSGARPAPPWLHSGVPAGVPAMKYNYALLGGGVIFVLLVMGGGFLAYQKFMVAPPEPPPSPKVVAKPKIPEPSVQAMLNKARQDAAAPLNEILAATPAAVPAPVQTVASPTTPAAVAEPVSAAPPPPASAAFKAWVDVLRVGGVRTGANTRVFIGGTAYVAGDVVNEQLGITFESYNPETRKLTFRDRTGAKVDRRN